MCVLIFVEISDVTPVAVGDGFGEAVHRLVVGAKQHATAPGGNDRARGFPVALAIELQAAAEALVPFGIEVDEDVDATEKLQPRADVEVGVRGKNTAGAAAVQARAFEIGVGQEAFDAGDLLEKAQEGR